MTEQQLPPPAATSGGQPIPTAEQIREQIREQIGLSQRAENTELCATCQHPIYRDQLLGQWTHLKSQEPACWPEVIPSAKATPKRALLRPGDAAWIALTNPPLAEPLAELMLIQIMQGAKGNR